MCWEGGWVRAGKVTETQFDQASTEELAMVTSSSKKRTVNRPFLFKRLTLRTLMSPVECAGSKHVIREIPRKENGQRSIRLVE